jgi:hypothetical protein
MSPQSSILVKSVALPSEHGGWGFLLEPIVLGLLIAPSWAGLALGLAALGAFLARHPLRLAMGDRRKGAWHPRTGLAWRFVALYGLGALGGLGAALALAGTGILVPLALALPLGLVQAVADARGDSRSLAAELCGATALASVAAAIALCGGFPLPRALAAWAVLASRVVPSILYVRARIRLDRLRDTSGRLLAWASHAVALATVLALAGFALAPWLAGLALAILLARALHGLRAGQVPVRPQVLGWAEVRFGTLTIGLLVAGYRLGL